MLPNSTGMFAKKGCKIPDIYGWKFPSATGSNSPLHHSDLRVVGLEEAAASVELDEGPARVALARAETAKLIPWNRNMSIDSLP